MREIQRVIASALIFSKDQKLLMGRKDPHGGGVYPDCWHIPGGGIDEGETLKNAVTREVKEEVGLDITDSPILPLPHNDSGTTEKTLKTGEKVLCHMDFHRFRVDIDQNAEDIITHLSDDLVEVRWFDREELAELKHVPGGRKFLQKMKYIQ